MEKILLTICALVLVHIAPAQESSFKFLKRNHKHHRIQEKVVNTSLQIGNLSVLLDDSNSTGVDLFPGADNSQVYGLLRNSFDVEVRRSSPAWMYRNYKLRSAASSTLSFRLVPFEERLTCIMSKKRKPLFLRN
ncbi:MAG: hypothetical protein AAF694_27255 [Bacteroidota bacterium]